MDNRLSALADRISEQLGVSVKIEELTKNNGTKRIAFRFESDSRVSPVIYPNLNLTDDEIVQYVVNTYNTQSSQIVDVRTIEGKLTKEYILKHAQRMLINKELNSCRLDDLVSKDFLDLSIIYRFDVIDCGYVTITKEMAIRLGITLEELELNCKANQPPESFVVVELRDILKDIAGTKFTDEFEDVPTGMYVITSSEKINGAGCLLLDSIFSGLSKQIDSDLFILPSSIHECIAVAKVEGYESKLLDMIAYVNNTQVADDEILSYSLYEFDRAEGKVKIVK